MQGPSDLGVDTVEVLWDADDVAQSEEVAAAVLDWCAGKKPLNFGGKLKGGWEHWFSGCAVMCLVKDDA